MLTFGSPFNTHKIMIDALCVSLVLVLMLPILELIGIRLHSTFLEKVNEWINYKTLPLNFLQAFVQMYLRVNLGLKTLNVCTLSIEAGLGMNAEKFKTWYGKVNYSNKKSYFSFFCHAYMLKMLINFLAIWVAIFGPASLSAFSEIVIIALILGCLLELKEIRNSFLHLLQTVSPTWEKAKKNTLSTKKYLASCLNGVTKPNFLHCLVATHKLNLIVLGSPPKILQKSRLFFNNKHNENFKNLHTAICFRTALLVL